MNKLVSIGLGAAAVVVALLIGAQLLGPPAPGGVGGAPSASPSPSPSPSPASETSLPQGPHIVAEPADDTPTITVTIRTSGWTSAPEIGGLGKGDDADPPEAFMLFWSWPAGTNFSVYEDPCRWKSTKPDDPATTVDEIVTALAAQQSRDASEPVDVIIGGYAGKHVTLHVPDDTATRAEAFADCDEGLFASYETPGDAPTRYHQGPGQIDEVWILDVDGVTVIIDAMYRPSTPAALIEEMRAIAESATFERGRGF